MTNSAGPDQLAYSEAKLIWNYTVFKGRVYLGSAGQGLIKLLMLIWVYTVCFISHVCLNILNKHGNSVYSVAKHNVLSENKRKEKNC